MATSSLARRGLRTDQTQRRILGRDASEEPLAWGERRFGGTLRKLG
jgi:hypothetical protein